MEWPTHRPSHGDGDHPKPRKRAGSMTKTSARLVQPDSDEKAEMTKSRPSSVSVVILGGRVPSPLPRAWQRGRDNAMCRTACSTEDAWAPRKGILQSWYSTPPDAHPRHSRNYR